jgi:hypothetical protein
LVAVIVLSLSSAWIMRGDGTQGARLFGRRLRLVSIAGMFIAVESAFGLGVNLLSILQHRASIESTPGAIESKIDTLSRESANRSVPAPSRIRRRIGGDWTDADCSTFFRFAVVDQALVIDGYRKADGVKLSHQVATITPSDADPDKLFTQEKGRAAEFTYSTNGVEPRLRWDDKRTPPKDLQPC